jgi:hypothetical protein
MTTAHSRSNPAGERGAPSDDNAVIVAAWVFYVDALFQAQAVGTRQLGIALLGLWIPALVNLDGVRQMAADGQHPVPSSREQASARASRTRRSLAEVGEFAHTQFITAVLMALGSGMSDSGSRMGACLDAQLGDLQVLRRIDVLAVEADRQTRLLGQQVDPSVSDLGQLGKRRCLLYITRLS